MRTLRILLALLALALGVSSGRAQSFTVPTGSGAGSVTTGSVTVLAPLVLSGTEIQLPQRISQLNTNYAFTNASSRDFYASNGNLYSKNLSLNHRWVYYDDFNQPMTTPGVFPDSPTGHKYNVFTGGGGNTNKINLVDGKWWLGETGAVYQSVTFGTNGVYGSAAPINTWGGTFSYQRSTNNTPDGYEQNLLLILSPVVDFLNTNYLHITVSPSFFRVQRESSLTNIIYAPHFGARYLAFDTNHSFTVTIISNNIVCDVAGMRYVGYDESLSTTYANCKVATYEMIGSPTNQFWGKWDSQYWGYALNSEHWQYAGPFGVRSNGTLQQITFNDRTESRYQLKHESDLFQLYDAISGEILFSADDTAQVVTVGGASAGTVNIIRPLIYTSGTPGTGKVLTDTDGSGTAVWQTPSAGAQTPWAQDIDGAGYALANVGRIELSGTGESLNAWLAYPGSAFAIARRTNAPAATGTTNHFEFSQGASVGQVPAIHSNTDGVIVWTNTTISSGGGTAGPVLEDHFMGGNTTSGTIGESGWIIATSSGTTARTIVSGEDTHPGVVTFETTETSTSGAANSLYLGAAAATLSGNIAAMAWTNKWVFRITNSTSLSNSIFRIGFGNTVSEAEPTHQITLSVTNGTAAVGPGVWFATTRSNSTYSTVSSSITATTGWMTNEIRSTGASNIVFAVNGTALTAIPFAPSTGMRPVVHIVPTAANEVKSLVLDYFKWAPALNY